MKERHTGSLLLRILQLERRLIALERVVRIRQVHDRQLGRVLAAEERRPLIESLGREHVGARYLGHFGEARGRAHAVRVLQVASVGEAVDVRGAVGDKQDVDLTLGLEERPDRIILTGYAAVDETELFLARDQGRCGVIVERIRVDGVQISGGEFVGETGDGT